MGIVLGFFLVQGVCTEAGMYALRERRVHVTQEDFEMAVAKVNFLLSHICFSLTHYRFPFALKIINIYLI